jgi:purine-cytosine permease-like protein
MPRVYWSLLVGVILVVIGVFLGATGLLWVPILAVPVMIAILFWFAERKAQHKPPLE